MADIDLPVFSFRANWREPMVERVSFLTDILRAQEGAEQRRELRQTPRRSFDVDLLLVGAERTFWDLFINALGGQEITAPLYWEVVSVPATLTATVSDRIDFDTSFREWPYHEGRLAILMGKTAMDYEVVEIAAVDAGGVDLALPVARSWPKGTKLLPLRRCVLSQVGELSHPSAAVASVTVQLRVVGPNPWTPAADDSPVYLGLPVFLSEPNWVENLSVNYDREVSLLDVDVGLTYQVDDLGRVLLGQAHRWFLPGREKLAGFRDLIYRHRGRAGSFWLPTFKADLKLVSPAAFNQINIEVEDVNFGYTGGPTGGREYIAIRHTGGTIIRKVLSISAGSSPATRRLNLDAQLGLALSPGVVRRISFVDVARFDTDEFDITHFGGVDQHHDASALFRTFKNTRTAPAPISLPISNAIMTDQPCGEGLEYLFYFSNNLPILTDGDTYNGGTVLAPNITLQMNLTGGGLSAANVFMPVSSIPRAGFSDAHYDDVLYYGGNVFFRFFPGEQVLRVRIPNPLVNVASYRIFTGGTEASWMGLGGGPWDVLQYVNGVETEWASTSGPNATFGSGFNGNPDFDDIIMFFNG